MRFSRRLLPVLLGALALGGCGGGLQGSPIEVKVKESQTNYALGFPIIATKNTTRVTGKDPVQDAAGAARAVYPAVGDRTRPLAVTLVDKSDWRGGIAAATLMAPPLRAPILLTDGKDLPSVTDSAVKDLRPSGTPFVERTQAFVVGAAGAPAGLRAKRISAKGPFALAAALDRFRSAAVGRPSPNIVVTTADDPRFAMPAAAWAARSGDAVFFTSRDALPPQTRNAIAAHGQPKSFVLGPKSVVSDNVLKQLKRLGPVSRIAGQDPVRNAIAFARYLNGTFGWGVQDPGHGLVIANSNRPLDAPAAAALSGSGTYGPLLLVDSAKVVPAPLQNYLLDIQPGYRSDPVRGVYNHAWLIGDESAISVASQAKADQLTEIVQVTGGRRQ